jgi:hypothetical protein
VRRRGQTLCQHVGHLLPSGGVNQLQCPVVDYLPQEIVTDVNVFCAVMELWVLGNGDGGLVVDVEDSGGGGVLAKFGEKLPQPYSFLGGVSPSNVLGFCAREHD